MQGLAGLERPALWPLPGERFAALTRLSARVDTESKACVRHWFYSVPVRHVGSRVIVELGAKIVTVHADGTRVAAHARGVHRRSEILDLDYYLEVLWGRPGAMPGATALAEARTTGRFRPEHQQFWGLARRRDGDQAGTRALCDVLLRHRYHHPITSSPGSAPLRRSATSTLQWSRSRQAEQPNICNPNPPSGWGNGCPICPSTTS